MEQLPDDVLAEICSYLPLKTAIQTKCLSTRFNRIISDESFTLMLSNRLKSSNKIILFSLSSSFYRPVYFQKFAPPNRSSYVELSLMPNNLLASSYGLLFLGYTTKSLNVLCVCNPITKVYQLINLDLKGSLLRHIGLAVDPNYNHKSLLTPKHKVVLAVSSSNEGSVFHTFNPEKHSWTKTQAKYYLHPTAFKRMKTGIKAVYANGCLHWILQNGDIVAFDAKKEQARTIKGPLKLNRSYEFAFGEFQGRLRIISNIDEKYVMYTLHDYERENWTVGSSVDQDAYGSLLFEGVRFLFRKRNRRHIYPCDSWKPKTGTLIDFMDGSRTYNIFDPTLAKVSPINYNIDDSDQEKVVELFEIKQSINKLMNMLASSI